MKTRKLPIIAIIVLGFFSIKTGHLWSMDKKIDKPVKVNHTSDNSMGKTSDTNSVPSNRGLVDKNGIPNEIEGNLSSGLKSTDFEDMAFEYFQNHKSIFKIEDARKEFRFSGPSYDKLVGDYQVRLDQVVNGVLVEGGQYRLLFDKNHKLTRVYGQINQEAKSVNTVPTISEEQANLMVIKDMEKISVGWPENAKTEINNSTLIIRQIDGNLKLVWGIGVTKGYYGYGYWIDAQSGKIIEPGPSLIK